MRLNEEQIDTIEDAYRAASAGEWEVTEPLHIHLGRVSGAYLDCGEVFLGELELVEDALSTVALHNNFPAMAQTIRELWRELAEAREIIEYYCDWWPDGVEPDDGARARAWLDKSGEGER